jgi:spermidine synthase
LPQAKVEVVEIDPRVIEAGRRFFKLDEHPRVKAHAQDARRFLVEAGDQRWDLIFGDAYAGVRSIPAHLVTREFFAQVAGHLTPQGVFVMNAITAVQGPQSKLLASLLATLRQVFAQVEVFGVQGGGTLAQNVIVMASQQSWGEALERYQAPGSWQERVISTRLRASALPADGVVFTDDFNPVDHIIAEGLAAQP